MVASRSSFRNGKLRRDQPHVHELRGEPRCLARGQQLERHGSVLGLENGIALSLQRSQDGAAKGVFRGSSEQVD
jgi:hypothetical protein